MTRASVLPHNYPQLQNLIKRDPACYRDEFLQQFQHFKSSLSIIQLRPAVTDSQFEDLVTFMSHVTSFYPDSKEEFPGLIMDFLTKDAISMNPSLRKCLVQCLLLVRKHSNIELLTLLELFFRLFRIQDKNLREYLNDSIVAEIRRANKPHKNNGLNKALQNFMFSLFEEMSTVTSVGEEEGLAVNKILQIAIELYKRGVWNDTRTVNVIADAALKRSSTKVMTTALSFFIGRFRGKSLADAGSDGEEEETEDEKSQYRDLQFRSHINGAKRSAQKKIKKALKAVHRKERQDNSVRQSPSFAAIQLLNDPQGFAEKLFGYLKKSTDPFEVKLLLMNVISRVIGSHRLVLLDFYSFLNRYIQPHQKEVTKVLAYATQAAHELVPGDVLEPMVLAIAHNFAAEFCANEVIAAGINGLREICARCPDAMNANLLQDLSRFKGFHDKGVVMATRSLIGLYREVNPELLQKRDRGKELSIAMKEGKAPKAKSYGINRIAHLDGSSIVKASTDDVSDNEINQEDSELSDDVEQEDGIEVFDESNISDDESQGDEEITDDDEEVDQAENPKAKKAKIDIVKLSSEKIFTAKEFSLLRKKLEGGEETSDDEGSQGSEKSASETEDSEDEYQDPSIVDPRKLESIKKKKNSYDERMASIHAGREGRLKYGSKKGKHNENKSVTNRLKQKKNKNIVMVAHKSSVRAKKRRSLKETHQALLKHQKHQRRFKK